MYGSLAVAGANDNSCKMISTLHPKLPLWHVQARCSLNISLPCHCVELCFWKFIRCRSFSAKFFDSWLVPQTCRVVIDIRQNLLLIWPELGIRRAKRLGFQFGSSSQAGRPVIVFYYVGMWLNGALICSWREQSRAMLMKAKCDVICDKFTADGKRKVMGRLARPWEVSAQETNRKPTWKNQQW